MVMFKRVARLFVIKTRFEAFLVIYALALGAVERGKAYVETYPGAMGWVLFAACTGVVFLAGAKLLDSVRPAPALATITSPGLPARRPSRFSRSRPSFRRTPDRDSTSPTSLRTD